MRCRSFIFGCLAIVLASACSQSTCTFTCGSGLYLNMPSTTLPPAATHARMCVADACAATEAEGSSLRAHLVHSMRDGEEVLVRVEALDAGGAIVATASGTVVGRKPDGDCKGAENCVAAMVAVDDGFTGVR